MELGGPSSAVDSSSPLSLDTLELDIPVISSEETPGHALLNSVVLSTILDCCPQSIWRTFRVQCKAWNEATYHRFRGQTPVHLDSLDYSQEDSIAEQNCYTTLHDLLHAPGDPFQFQKYPFHHLILGSDVFLDCSQLQVDFFTCVGPWLKVLCLSRVTLTPTSFSRLIFKHTPNLEELEYNECYLPNEPVGKITTVPNLNCCRHDQQINLKSVRICMQSTDDTNDADAFPLSWTTFFVHFPNLKSLKLEGFPTKWSEKTFEAIINAIVSVRETNNNQVLNLTTFDVRKFIYFEDVSKFMVHLLNFPMRQTVSVTPKIIPNLIQICSSLHTLTLHINGLEGPQLSQILEACSNLIHLQLEQHSTREPIKSFRYDSIPRTLQKLAVYSHIFSTWEFLLFTPNLTQLLIQINNEVSRFECPDQPLQMRIAPLEHLTSLQFVTQYPYFLLNPEAYASFFGKVMPNLKKLCFPMNMKSFTNACSIWPHMEEFEIIKDNSSCIHSFAARFMALKSLKVLKIVSENDFSNYFEPRHVRNVFLQMPKLKSLSACFHQDDVAAFRLLKARIENTDGCIVKIPVGVKHEKQFFEDMPLKDYLEYRNKGITDKQIQAAFKETFRGEHVYKIVMSRIEQR